MTKSVMKQIFIVNANRIEAGIKKQGADILSECTDFALLIDGLSGDKMRKAILEDGRFAFLYDTKSDKGKMVMSDKMRQLKSAMLDIFTHAEQFTKWYASEEKTGVTSLRGIRDAIKPKKEKAEKIADETETDASADETETENCDNPSQKETLSKAQAYEAFLMTWKSFGYGDSIAFADYVATTEAGKIADMVDERKSA